MDSFPILSTITYLPLIGALAIMFAPRASTDLPRKIALVASAASFVLSLVLLFTFDHNAEFQFVENVVWLDDLGVSYLMAVDGIAVLLIALTTLLSLISIWWSYNTITERVREYYIAILLLEVGMLGVFMALDLFLFYIFWELMLIPMALLIGIWGHSDRVYAAVKFFLYTLFGSLLMLVAIVATYQSYFNETGERTLNILKLQGGTYSDTFQFWVFAAFFVAFAVKVPMFPFHTWLPDAHVQAPTAASVILAAVMLKMGGYGMLRFNLPLFPEGTEAWAPTVIVLSIIGIIYGAFVALVQKDFKKIIAYSSVSHMGFVTLGIFIMNMQGMDGAMMVMLAHGFNSGALFLIVGLIYERAHTRDIRAFGGMATRMPVWAGYFSLFLFGSIGLPGLSGFVGEFLVTLGAWQYNKIAGAITFTVVIWAAWYMLFLYQRIAFGRAWGELADPGDTELTREEIAELDRSGFHGHLGTAAPPAAVSGGDHAAPEHGHGVEELHLDRDEPPVETDPTTVGPVHEDQLDSRKWHDVTLREHLALAPLAILTIVFGVYPKPVFDIVEPSFQAILDGATRVLGS